MARGNRSVHVLAIDGSTRPESNTRKLLEVSQGYFERAGATFILFSQLENALPLYDGGGAALNSKSVQLLFRLIEEADVIVLSSPEYHGSMSGVLKNALDWLNHLPDESAIKGKLFGLIGGGGLLANSGATVQMMMAVRALHGWLMPEILVSVANIWDAFSAEGKDLLDVNLRKRLGSFAEKLIDYAMLFRDRELRKAA